MCLVWMCVVWLGVLSQHLIVCKGRSVQLYTFKVTQASITVDRPFEIKDTSDPLCICICALCCVGCEGA